MKKTTVFLIFSVLIAILLSGYSFVYAQTELGELNEDLEYALENDGTAKEIFQLIYDGNRLVDEGVGESQEIERFNELKKSYYLDKAINDVTSACDDKGESVKTKNGVLYFYTEQYSQVLLYKQEFLDSVEEKDDPQTAVDEFFAKVALLPDIVKLSWERDRYITQNVSEINGGIFDTVNANLSLRGFTPFAEKLEYSDDEEYREWLKEILSAAFFSEEVPVIIDAFYKTIDDLNALSESASKDEYDALAQNFLTSLSSYRQRTLTAESGIKAIAAEGAKDTLQLRLQEAGSQSEAYRQKVAEIVERATLSIDRAESVDEIKKILDSAQNEIADIEIKDTRWVIPLIFAIVLFILFAVGIAVYFKFRQRKKGVEKYNSLLEEERERMDAEVYKVLRQENAETPLEEVKAQESDEIIDDTKNNIEVEESPFDLADTLDEHTPTEIEDDA